MNVLMICPRLPALDMKGDQVLAYNRLVTLTEAGFKVSVIYVSSKLLDEKKLERDLKALNVKIYPIRISLIDIISNFVSALFDLNVPVQTCLYNSSRFQKMIETIISKEDINALHLIGIRVFGNIRTFEGDIWLEYIDSMALNFKSRIGKTKSAFMRYFLDLELKRLLIYEKKLSLKARHSFIVSKKDKLFIGAENINVIQLGLDLSKYVRSRNEALDKYIVFSGNMSYHPNIVSTLWFIENCWPILKKHQTNIKLVIAGRNPADSILNLAKFDGQIRVTGEVEDMGVILSKATVAIAPMQSGSGMQLKILEAMGCSVPVVTTSLGLGDIDAVSNKEVKVADTPSEFTQAVVDLCDDNTLNYEIGAAGNQYLKRAHSNEVISSQFIDIVSPKAV